MQSVGRKLAFVLASSNHGTLIVNRFDYRMVDQNRGYGVGFQILETSSFDPGEVKLALDLLTLRRKHYGDGVIGIDCGANIGVHTIEWAKMMTGWGSVLSIEAQERIYYALAGNIAINNCFNAHRGPWRSLFRKRGHADPESELFRALQFRQPGTAAAQQQ